MNITVRIEKDVEVKTLEVRAGVRYWCDATVNGVEGNDDDDKDPGIPCRVGGLWKPSIDIATGTITNWLKGTTASVHYKVCDQCGWALLGPDGEVVKEAEDGYVPGVLCPKESGYGDYIIMDINEDGVIDGWKFDPTDFVEDAD